MQQALNRYDAIFLAEVMATESSVVSTDGYESRFQKVEVKVAQSWKFPGQHNGRVTLETETTCCLCGYQFPESGSFLVFAQRNAGRLQVSICSPTQTAESAAEKIKALDDAAR